MSDVPMVQAIEVGKTFDVDPVLQDITFEVPRGQVVALIGPSGSGKSTLLRSINHLENVTLGRLYVDGRLVGYREKNGKIVPEGERRGGGGFGPDPSSRGPGQYTAER